MKKNHIFILGLTLLVSGCSQEELWNKQSTASEERTFTASFEQNESRTYIDEGNLQRWTKADKISLFEGNTLNHQYQFNGETGDRSGTFTKTSSPSGTGKDLNSNYAVYPYSSDIQITENGMITVALPEEQKYAVNSFGLGDNTMVAVTQNTEDTSLKFKNVGGYLKLKFYGSNISINTIKLTGNSNEKIAGTANVSPAYRGNITTTMSDEATESITLNCENGIEIGNTIESATEFWIVVPPTVFELGFTINVAYNGNCELMKTTNNRVVIERNTIKTMEAIELEYKQELPDLTGNWLCSETYQDTGNFRDSYIITLRADGSAGMTNWSNPPQSKWELKEDGTFKLYMTLRNDKETTVVKNWSGKIEGNKITGTASGWRMANGFYFEDGKRNFIMERTSE